MQEFNKRLKELRNKYNKTQKEIADKMGISVRAYQHYETGTRFPDFQGLIFLADFFDVSLDFLTSRNDNPDSHWMTLAWWKDFNNIMGAMIQAEAIKIKRDKERKQ